MSHLVWHGVGEMRIDICGKQPWVEAQPTLFTTRTKHACRCAPEIKPHRDRRQKCLQYLRRTSAVYIDLLDYPLPLGWTQRG